MKIAIIAGIVVILGLIVGLGIYPSFYNERTITCTVTDKDRGMDSEGNSNYRVYTEQCGTFSNEDSFLRGKLDSGDVQGQLEEGQTYELTVVGPRIPFMSVFPNILEVQPVG